MIREIGYDPSGMKMAMKLWIFQMTPFGSWNPGYSGIVGGQYATIVEEQITINDERMDAFIYI